MTVIKSLQNNWYGNENTYAYLIVQGWDLEMQLAKPDHQSIKVELLHFHRPTTAQATPDSGICLSAEVNSSARL